MTLTTIKILNWIYGLIVLFFALDSLTSLEIKNQVLKSFIYFGLCIGTALILICNLIVIKTKSRRIVWSIFPAIILILILITGPMKILFSTGAWQTQAILYQNGHLNFKKVEFQMQDRGALGYNKRTVEVLYLTPLFMITQEVPVDINKRAEWVKVNKEVNELGLKEP